jgi:hypothetical protein
VGADAGTTVRVNSPSPRKLLATCLVGAWLVAAGWGMWRLAGYSLTPGAQGTAPEIWPATATLARESDRWTVVVALHPECPCSQATVEELDAIVAKTGKRLRVHALFVELPGLPQPAERSELWARASRIPGVDVRKDPAGAEARRFGSQTSGETRLYDGDGHLRFRGGITVSRGHVGDNPGAAAIVNFALHPASTSAPVVTPVFGCALWDRSTANP